MSTTKKAFVGKPKGNSDERQAIALEFIAHYLDRIDDHLEKLAAVAESGGATEKLRLQLMNIERAMDRFERNKS